MDTFGKASHSASLAVPAGIQHGPHSPEWHTSAALPGPLPCHSISLTTSLCSSWEQNRWSQGNRYPTDTKSWDRSLFWGLITGLSIAWHGLNRLFISLGPSRDEPDRLWKNKPYAIKGESMADHGWGRCWKTRRSIPLNPPTKSCLPLNNAQSLELYPVPAEHHAVLVLISITSYIWHQGHRRPEETISE